MKTIVLAVFVLALSTTSNALALTGYTQTYTYNPLFSLNNGSGHSSTSFTFAGVTDQFVAGTNSPSLSLDLTGNNNHFSDKLQVIVQLQATPLATLTTEHPVFYFNTLDLNKLNSAIVNNTITFNVLWDKGSSTLRSATLNGTLAPEPASAFLVAAGLAGLPFLRRLKQTWFRRALRPQV